MPENESDPQGTTPDAPSVASSDSPPGNSDELPDLATALRQAAQERSAGEARDVAGSDEPDDDEDAEESDPASEEESAGEKPDETREDADRASPRDRPTQTQRLKKRLSELETEANQHKERATRYEQAEQQRQQTVMQLLGSDDEYRALMQKRLDPNAVLSYDEESRYGQLHAERQNAALYFGQAQHGLRIANERGVKATAEKYGLTADELLPLAADAGQLLDKAISATEARVRREMQDEIDRLTADRDSLLLKRGARAQDPGAGGRSGGMRHEPNWDDAQPGDFFASAIREDRRKAGRV